LLPDNRLNALIPRLLRVDLELQIRTVLEEIDRQESPEVIQTIAAPGLDPGRLPGRRSVARIVTSGTLRTKMKDSKEGGGEGRGGQPSPTPRRKLIAGPACGKGGAGGNRNTQERSDQDHCGRGRT